MKNIASLTQVSVFVRIVELGSLSAAARELNLTPSAVSKSLAQLEHRLGMLLVKRTTRSLKLTDAGKVIYERANAIVQDVEDTLDAARQLQNCEGSLRITSSIAFGAKQLPRLVAAYMAANPAIDVNISLDDRCVNLAEENYDIALRITSGTDWGYAARKLAPIKWVYCASPRYLDRYGLVRRPQDVLNRDCLVYPAMTMSGNWVFDGPESVHVKVRPKLVSNSSLALREAALAAVGIACLPTYLVADDIAEGKLVTVAPDYRCAISHELYAMYYRSRFVNPVVRSFIDFLVEFLKDGGSWESEHPGAPHL